MTDLQRAEMEARRLYGRLTPYRVGLVAGKLGLRISTNARSINWRRLFLAGREQAQGHAVWPYCGHPKTPENTQRVGKAGDRCRECRRRISLESKKRRAA